MRLAQLTLVTYCVWQLYLVWIEVFDKQGRAMRAQAAHQVTLEHADATIRPIPTDVMG